MSTRSRLCLALVAALALASVSHAASFSGGGGVPSTGSVSAANSSTTPLAAGATFTGTAIDVSLYESVVVACYADQAGSLYVDFSADGTNWDSTLTYTVAASTNEVHRLTVTRRYMRVRMTNTSGSPQTVLRLSTMWGNQGHLTSPLSSSLQSDADAIATRSVLMGQTDSGAWNYTNVTGDGHLEVAVHSPLLPFGSVHAEKMTPVFQTDAVYGINSGQTLTTSSLTGSVTASDSIFSLSTGTTIYSQASLQSRKRLRYRPGQGVIARFTALYTTPVASSYQVVGVGHAEDGVYFGYKNTEFGILHSSRGVREVRTLTISTASSTTENVTVTLNGVACSIAVTNSGNINRTVWEVSQGSCAGWDEYPAGSTIVFVAKSAGPLASGAYSVSGSTIVGSFARTTTGVAATEVFIPQSSWNGDKMDGTGTSGVTLDPTKGNVYQIGIQYLGFGALEFQIETNPTDSNNPVFVTVHTIKYANANTVTSFSNPAFPFTAAVYSAGSTTNLTAKVGSFAGFIEGDKVLHGNRFSYFAQSTGVTSGTLLPLFTIMNKRTYAGRTNQAVVNILELESALKHTSPVIIYVIKNGSLGGNPSFVDLATNSVTSWDQAATSVTYSTADQLIWTGHMGDTGEIDHNFGNGTLNAEEVTLQPGEWVTVAAKSTTGSPSYVTAAMNTREDQ